MTWIKTIPPAQADEKLLNAMHGQMHMYPAEYQIPVESLAEHEAADQAPSIIMSHSLLPDTLFHSFATYGTLLSPDLPLTRRQHELIAATVSALNDCFY
jgi:hypothetical protein